MLSHLSSKFTQPAKEQIHEPRAALFLNRFTRTLSIMYATTGIEDIIGISADDMRGRSFYYCIAENCLQDAIQCLEQAKSNDSIAYLRFWFRDPRQDDQPLASEDDSDEEMTTDASFDDDRNATPSPLSSTAVQSADSMDVDSGAEPDSRNSSHDSTRASETHEAIFGEERPAHSSASSTGDSPEAHHPDTIELEAVISCASDGLVVCLRKARPMIPPPTHRPSQPVYKNGLFAAPWANEPVLPPFEARAGAGFTPAFAPALGPRGAHQPVVSASRAADDKSDFMAAIRDAAVFAWALAGINGTVAEHGLGKPIGESLPPNGLPVWASDRRQVSDHDATANGWHSGREMFGSSRSPQEGRQATELFGDPGLAKKTSLQAGGGSSSSGSTPKSGGPR